MQLWQLLRLLLIREFSYTVFDLNANVDKRIQNIQNINFSFRN